MRKNYKTEIEMDCAKEKDWNAQDYLNKNESNISKIICLVLWMVHGTTTKRLNFAKMEIASFFLIQTEDNASEKIKKED